MPPEGAQSLTKQYLTVLDVVSEGVDHRSGSTFGSKEIEIVQSLQSCLELDGIREAECL